MKRPEPLSFQATNPAITRWIKGFGRIEIGTAGFTDGLVKAIDRDVTPWCGKGEYESIDEALRDMEQYCPGFLYRRGAFVGSSALATN